MSQSTLPTPLSRTSNARTPVSPRVQRSAPASDRPWVLLWAVLSIFGVCLFAAVNVLAEEQPGSDKSSLERPAIFPLEARTDRMKVVSGTDSGTTVDLVLEEADADNAHWALRAKGLNTLLLREASDGGIDVVSVELADQQQALEFDPPAMYLPASLRPGESHSRSGTVTIRNTQDGSVRTTGDYKQTIKPASAKTFELPLGKRDGFEVTNSVDVETDWASVSLELITGFDDAEDNPGLLRRDMKTKITKAALFGSTTQRVLELAE